MKTRRPEMARWGALLGGCLCVILGCYGAVYAVKASIAQTAYRRIKYGHFLDTRFEVAPTRDPEVIRIECARLMNLYPHNYYLPVLVADVSLSYALVSSNAEDKAEWLRRACRWDDDGMRLNPYNAEVYSVHASILQETGRALEAARFWREEVLGSPGEFGNPDSVLRRGEFWNPARHDAMARLYLDRRANQLERAIAELPWVRDKDTRDRIVERQKQYDAILKLRSQK